MSIQNPPRCLKHPSERVVGVCGYCLKERLAGLTSDVDVASFDSPRPSFHLPSVHEVEAGTSSQPQIGKSHAIGSTVRGEIEILERRPNAWRSKSLGERLDFPRDGQGFPRKITLRALFELDDAERSRKRELEALDRAASGRPSDTLAAHGAAGVERDAAQPTEQNAGCAGDKQGLDSSPDGSMSRCPSMSQRVKHSFWFTTLFWRRGRARQSGRRKGAGDQRQQQQQRASDQVGVRQQQGGAEEGGGRGKLRAARRDLQRKEMELWRAMQAERAEEPGDGAAARGEEAAAMAGEEHRKGKQAMARRKDCERGKDEEGRHSQRAPEGDGDGDGRRRTETTTEKDGEGDGGRRSFRSLSCNAALSCAPFGSSPAKSAAHRGAEAKSRPPLRLPPPAVAPPPPFYLQRMRSGGKISPAAIHPHYYGGGGGLLRFYLTPLLSSASARRPPPPPPSVAPRPPPAPPPPPKPSRRRRFSAFLFLS